MITEKITSGQKKQILRVLEDGLDAGDLTKEMADEILKVGNLLQADLKVILAKYSIADKRFGPAIKEFEITVPTDYNHGHQIDQFAKKTKNLETTHYFNNALTSENFAKATTKLEPGKTYKVKIIPITSGTPSSGDCMNRCRKEKGFIGFVGGQGLTLAQELKKEEFPVGKWTVSFDEEKALWQDSVGYRWVPRVSAYTVGDFGFHLGDFGDDWSSGFCVLCFCDISA